MSYFSFLNIPGKLQKEEILKTLNLNENTEKYIRFYKKYLYWLLVSENKDFCDEFEKSLRNIRFNQDTSLRYEYLPKSLKSSLVKKIQQIAYNKEASDLKACPDKSGISSNNNDSFSWRKKSNDLTTQKVNVENNTVSNVRIKRERFNSDGDKAYNNPSISTLNIKTTNQNTYENVFGQAQIKVDYSKLVVNYNTESKNPL